MKFLRPIGKTILKVVVYLQVKRKLKRMNSGKTENKSEVKRISAPKAAVAGFIRPKDGTRIWVYPRTGESTENAIKRVMRSNGAEGGEYELAN